MGLKALCPHFPLGYGGLGLSIEGPSKVDINCEDMEDGTCKVTYCPTEPGTYIINIKFADKHVPGKALGRGWDGPEAGDEPSEMPGPLPPNRKPLHGEGDGRGPHEGEHHAAQAGAFHRHHRQHLRPQPQDPRWAPTRAWRWRGACPSVSVLQAPFSLPFPPPTPCAPQGTGSRWCLPRSA